MIGGKLAADDGEVKFNLSHSDHLLDFSFFSRVRISIVFRNSATISFLNSAGSSTSHSGSERQHPPLQFEEVANADRHYQ